MKNFYSAILFILFTQPIYAGSITGKVKNKEGVFLNTVSIAILYEQDSTLASFAVTDDNGFYEIKHIKSGSYLLQAASAGYYTVYKKIVVKEDGASIMEDLILEVNEKTVNLGEVVVSGEKIPIKISGDTVEYNAGSFRVKPNAAVEDLLRQLPGVEVDEAGNIKAMGKDVNKVMVDGKDFFGNDPKIATKNLPAEAVEKVQTFGKQSDMAEFTGIQDGQKQQTINLILKEGKKSGHFGEVYGGYGINKRYEAGAKTFSFRKKTQLALLGATNNINNIGFSFNDYMAMKGDGLQGLFGGDFSFPIGNVPINFGQTLTGNNTSGALAANYTYEPRVGNQLNISYNGNGLYKKLNSWSNSTNFLPGGDYDKEISSNEKSKDFNNRLYIKWLNKIDSMNQLSIKLNGNLGKNNGDVFSTDRYYLNRELLNAVYQNNELNNNQAGLSGDIEYVHKMKTKWQLLTFMASGQLQNNQQDRVWRNETTFYDLGISQTTAQYQDNLNQQISSLAAISATRSLGNAMYLEPVLKLQYKLTTLNRNQGFLPRTGAGIDSLSPFFENRILTYTPGISLKRSTNAMRWHIGLNMDVVNMQPTANKTQPYFRNYIFFLPTVSITKNITGNKTVSLDYHTNIYNPSVEQLLPVTYYINPLESHTGNISLKPEYQHRIGTNFHHYDAFNGSSLFAYINIGYTANSVQAAQNINANLSRQITWVNTPYKADIRINSNFGFLIRALRVKASVKLSEDISRTIIPVNNVNNHTTNYQHGFKLSANNTNNAIWNIRGEAAVNITDVYYSINKKQNNTFYNYSANLFVGCNTKNEKWYWEVNSRVTHYAAKTFNKPVTIPLLNMELSRFLFENNRGTITLKGFDLLNKNTSIQRTGNINYLTENRTNIINRYVMLSFRYKLNKAGKP